jgi:hypothetical protein
MRVDTVAGLHMKLQENWLLGHTHTHTLLQSNHLPQHLPPELLTADEHAEPDNDKMRFPLPDVRSDFYLPSRTIPFDQSCIMVL